MPHILKFGAPLAALCCALAGASAQAQEYRESIVLSDSPDVVRWADVYKIRPERPDDPYFHVRVIERQKDWQAWRFDELVFHITVTPKALEASRIDKAAKIQSYKDVEIRSVYHRWLDEPSTRSEVPISETDI